MLQAYRQHVAERASLGIPPLPPVHERGNSSIKR